MIVNKSIIIFIGSLFWVSPLFADYSQMNQDLENYSPPVNFISPIEVASLENKNVYDFESLDKKTIEKIENLKFEYEKEIIENRTIDFLSNTDPKILEKITRVVNDQKIVKNFVARNLRLNELEILAALRNPSVLAAQKKVIAELESFNQVMDLDQNLKQYSAFTEGLNNKVGPLKMKESLTQKYPYPGLTSLKGSVIQHQVGAALEKMKIKQKNIITLTRKAYWDLVFIDQSIGITSETVDAFNRLKDVATTLYKSGKTSFQDVIKTNIKIEILKEDLSTLFSRKKNIEVKIRELLNLPVYAKLGKAIHIEPQKDIGPLDKLYISARQNRQEIKVVKYQIGKVENMIEMAESMIQNPYTLNFSVFEDEAVNSVGSDASKSSFSEKTMAAMKNNTPIKPWYGIDNPWLNQTRQNLLSRKQTLIKQENEADRMVRETWFMVDQNEREFNLFNDRVLPLSKSALDVSAREYESGSIPFSQAIGSYSDWLKAKLSVAKKRSDLGIAIANLEKTIGRSFDTNHLKGK